MAQNSFETDIIDSTHDLYKACVAIRTAVFHVEQQIPAARDLDDKEDTCLHYLFSKNGVPFGTCRVRLVDGVVKIERFALLKDYRGQGLAGPCFKKAMDTALEKLGVGTIKIGAQAYLQNFYTRLGFKAEGDIFDDVGIPHITMTYQKAA